jgi:hypothetical protein
MLEKRAHAGKTSGCGQTREGFPQVNTSTYTREMYVCQCINGREISTTLKMILNYDERASSTSTAEALYRRGSSPGQLETVRCAQRRARLHLCAALRLDDPLGPPLGERLADCPVDGIPSSATDGPRWLRGWRLQHRQGAHAKVPF